MQLFPPLSTVSRSNRLRCFPVHTPRTILRTLRSFLLTETLVSTDDGLFHPCIPAIVGNDLNGSWQSSSFLNHMSLRQGYGRQASRRMIYCIAGFWLHVSDKNSKVFRTVILSCVWERTARPGYSLTRGVTNSSAKEGVRRSTSVKSSVIVS